MLSRDVVLEGSIVNNSPSLKSTRMGAYPNGRRLCSTLGGRPDDLGPGLVGACPPCAGVGVGGGHPLPPQGSGGISTGKIWILYIRNHTFSCICILDI